jgi:hypothetical protein
MTRQEMIEGMHELYRDALKINKARSVEYAREGDPFWNFRELGQIMNKPAEWVILFYVGECFLRLRNFAESEEVIPLESVRDKCVDLANFAGLFYQLLASQRKVTHENNVVDMGTADRLEAAEVRGGTA